MNTNLTNTLRMCIHTDTLSFAAGLCLSSVRLHRPSFDTVYGKFCYDTQGQWAKAGAGAAELPLTLQRVQPPPPPNPSQRKTPAADGWPPHCATTVNEAIEGPFPPAYLRVCECLRWHAEQGVFDPIREFSRWQTNTLIPVHMNLPL